MWGEAWVSEVGPGGLGETPCALRQVPWRAYCPQAELCKSRQAEWKATAATGLSPYKEKEKSKGNSSGCSAFIPSGLGPGVPGFPRLATTARPPLRSQSTPFNSSLSLSRDPDTWRALAFLLNAGVGMRLEPHT